MITDKPIVAIVGGGPAGLMAAEALSRDGHAEIHLFDAMPSVGRKFLMAGRGGLNLTHSEPLEELLNRYGAERERLMPMIAAFGPDAICAWAKELGIETFIGSSGRIFPTDMKAAPLLRAWLRRLRAAKVHFHVRHRWHGWNDAGGIRFTTPWGAVAFKADATILALGGASWPQLGSDGAWIPVLERAGIAIAPLRPANCGFDVGWSEHFRSRFAGAPVKSVIASAGGARRQGEFVVTDTGVEGSLIYAFAATLRDEIERRGTAQLLLDLAPDRDEATLSDALSQSRGSRSVSTHIHRASGLNGVKAGLLRECLSRETFETPAALARGIKSLPIKLVAPRPIGEAISSAGGVRFDALDANLMLSARPGVFCAGEMLDWEAITGGYLLTACFASGHAAGLGVARYLAHAPRM